ncbi:MAG: ROK family protein [Verrucomicrobiota bacterium]
MSKKKKAKRSAVPLAIGLDFGGTSVKLAVCQGPKVIHKAEPIDTGKHQGVDALIGAMVESIQQLLKKYPKIVAVGAGVPGFVDFDSGFLYNLTNVRGWTNVPFKTIMEKKLGLPVTVENDANAMAYAEWKYGAAKGHTNVVCITLGTGVGGGLILNGKPYRGTVFGAGEIGQMGISYRGRKGGYGNPGALEKYVGNQQIETHALQAYAAIGEPKKRGECTPRHIAEAAAAGDPIARKVWGDVGIWLGSALASIVWILNPDAIVIGGGVSNAGDLLFNPVRRQMHSTLNPVFFENLDIVPAQFGNEAGTIGCAALALDQLG